MRYQPLPNDFYRRNRQKLSEKLSPKSVVVIHSNDEFPISADAKHPFRQNKDLVYLTGVDQEETTLLLAPDHPNPQFREVLFLRETNGMISTWEGKKLTQFEAIERTGIDNIQWNSGFEDIFHQVVMASEHIYLYQNEYDRGQSEVVGLNDRFIESTKKRYPLHTYQRVAPLIHGLRTIKEKEELQPLKHAINLTKNALSEVLRNLQPGMYEYELEAILSKAFLEKGSRGFAYEPIVAGGINSCVLHYITNDHILKDGDVVLMDVGAEYANYNADITRVFPVNGAFSQRQKEVYTAVLRVKNYATSLLTPGLLLKDYQAQVVAFMEQQLIELGLLDKGQLASQSKENPLYRRYFMHGTSHFLGLDVHDVGSRHEPLEAGMILTVEPGIYIKEEKIGIRLEDDVLITENGFENLSEEIPIELSDVADWIHECCR